MGSGFKNSITFIHTIKVMDTINKVIDIIYSVLLFVLKYSAGGLITLFTLILICKNVFDAHGTFRIYYELKSCLFFMKFP